MTDHKELIAEGKEMAAKSLGKDHWHMLTRLTAALEAAQPRQIDREALARAIAVAQNVPFAGPKQYRITDSVIAYLSANDGKNPSFHHSPATGEVTAHQFDIAAEAFYETPTDPTLNGQGNRRKALANAMAAIGIEVRP